MQPTLRIAWGSLVVSFVVLALKLAAYQRTGSIALYSDALETLINVAGAVTALFALWYSARPADANHPYGHHKVEYLSAIVEGAMVLLTAFAIGRQAWIGWAHPHAPQAPFLGIALNVSAGIINLFWALVLIRGGRRWKSPALVAGGRHIMTDVWTTCAVLAGFALVPLTGWLQLDSLVAAFVAANILWSGYGILRQSVGGLMDEVTDLHSLDTLRDLIGENANGAIEAHDVRSRTVGSVTFIEFHLVVPGDMSVADAHEICDRIEAGIRRSLGDAVINIHVEPDNKAKHRGIVVMA